MYRLVVQIENSIRWLPIILVCIGLLAGGGAFGQDLPEAPGNGESSARQGNGEPSEDGFDNFEEFEGFEGFDEFDQPEQKIAFDPLEPYNRAMTRFNDRVYFWVLEPVASGYEWAVPEPVRLAVNRFFRNWAYPVRLVNNLLQLKGRPVAEETVRFFVNTTAGIGGLFDPARKLPRVNAHPEDFGQTFGVWGIGSGFPVVLPFLGPSNLRDAIGLVPDGFFYPLYYPVNLYEGTAMTAYERVNYTSLHLGEYEELTKDAIDLYTFMQNAYSQNREKKIKD